MKKIILLTTIITLIFITTGCGSDDNQLGQNTSTSTKTMINKKPVEEDSENKIYKFCEAQGNEIIIRFNDDVKMSQAFCRFADTSECEAESFYKGLCAPGQGSKIYETKAIEEIKADCDNNSGPVCGVDKKTYTNECALKVQNVNLLHTGNCATDEVKTNSNDDSKSAYSGLIKEDGKPDWLPIATDMIQNEKSVNPRVFIERCSYSGDVIYYQTNNKDNYFSILYDKNGEVICYPNNDIDNSCPDYFHKNNRWNNCENIWLDNR